MTADVSRLQVDEEGAGERLDRFLAARFSDMSRSRLGKLIDGGDVRVDGAQAKASFRLKPGMVVELEVPPPEPARPEPEALGLSVLHDDADVVVVDKPAGMVVHPAAGVTQGTLVNALLFHVTDLAGIGGELRPGIVHRLDKDTSGALVVAKNDLALVRLQASFQARAVEKRYLALVHGNPADAGTFDTAFGRHPVDRVKMTSRLPDDAPKVRRAVTRWTVRERFEGASLVEIELETGRTHQIRVHFSDANHPLLADETYGGTRRDKKAPPLVQRAAKEMGRQALHAWRLAFPHPRTGVRIAAEAPLPADFERALAVLRKG